MARPKALTPAVKARLLEALLVGAPIRLAVQYAGIGESTYYEHQAEDAEFAEEVLRARSSAAIKSLALIQKAAPTDWRAADAALKLMFPADFRAQVDVDARMTAEVKTTHEVSPSFVASVLAALDSAGIEDLAGTEPEPLDK